VIRKRCTGREAALSGKTRTPDQHSHFGNSTKIFLKSGMFFVSQKPALNHHVKAPNHHEKTTNLPSKITTISCTPLKKPRRISANSSPHPSRKNLPKITKPNPPPIEKSCRRNES
jgi:hypothetical protein